MFLILFFIFLFYLIYHAIIKPSLYWKNSGIYYVNMFARLYTVFIKSNSFIDSIKTTYDDYPDRRYYGSYQFFKPSLYVRDLELIKNITVKDFDHFTDHLGLATDNSDDIMSLNLFSMKGNEWREMRATLSPAFTGNKMRMMFKLISENAVNFTNYFLSKNEKIAEVELKDAFSHYTTDVIASCAFGIECDSLKNPNNEFYTAGKFVTIIRGTRAVRGLFAMFYPKVAQLFKVSILPPSVTDFFKKIVTETIREREKNHTIRPDMIHLLMEARKGKLQHEKVDSETAGFATVEESHIGMSKSSLVLTDNVVTAQALIFFIAGFETASTLLSLLSYELALHPEIQERLVSEIDETLEECDGKLVYENILKMKYLDQVVCETLRKYPPGFALSRTCVKDYFIPAKLPNENDFTMRKGCAVGIPVYGIHMDPKYFPEPYKFDPERFNDENKSKIVPGSYIPFGIGPRNCIGSRFALLETKALIVSLYSKFEVVPIEKTPIPLVFQSGLGFIIKGGIWIGLKKRESSQL